jgi:type I restriction enzyme, S subunit
MVPSNWAAAKLGEIIELATGKLDANAATRNGRYPFFTCGQEPLRIDTYAFDQEAVLLAGNGDFNVKHYIGKFNAYQRTYVLRPVLINGRFLYFLFNNYLPDITSQERGSTVRYIRRGDIEDTYITIAPLSEQQRIVAKIDSLKAKSGRARGHLDHLPRLVEKYKQAVLAAAFRGDLTRDWQNADRLQISWRKALAGELFEWSSGKNLPTKQLVAGAVPVIGGNGVNGQHNQFLIDYPTLVVGRVGAQCGNVHLSIGRAWITDNAIYASQISPEIDLQFAVLLLRSKNLNELAGGSGQPYVSQTILNAIELALPSVKEQKEIVRRIEHAFSWIDLLASETTKARRLVDHLDQAVLAKAFRGELVPQDPSDEPASVLLERIRAERPTSGRVRGARGRARATA